jgi:hypothetical protein
MFNALIRYVINAYPEVLRLCKILHGVTRQMVNNDVSIGCLVYLAENLP